MDKNDTIQVGVIGAGRIGTLHMKHICHRIDGAEVAAVSDTSPQAAEEAGRRFSVSTVTSDYRELLDDQSIDAVLICSGTNTHAEFIVQAADAGKHIFCEKPIAFDLAAIDRALTAVEKAGVKLQIGFNRRFDANYRRVWELVRSGSIGELHIIKIISRDPAPPPIEYVKLSGGIFVDMMIHDFDMARYLSGSDVESVYTLGAVNIDPAIGEAGDIDTALVTLRFENGVMGTIDNSRKAVFGYDQRVELFGSGGMVSTENVTPNRVTVSTAEKIWHDLPLNFFMERYIDSFITELRSFFDCLRSDTAPSVSGKDGKIPVVTAKAAELSLKEARPVKLSEIA